MKELTIKEKARAYDRIVEKAKIEKEKSRNLGLLEFIDENFPELKESEDEKIRKEIYSALKYLETELGWDAVGDVDILDAYAWLEKQGKQETLCDKCRKEHPSHSCQDITELGRCTIEHIQSQTDKVEPKDYSSIDPHFFKTTDKVEPKFKVGDKIRRKNPSSFDKDMQVARIEKDYYICNHIGKFSSEVVPFSEEYCYDLIEQKPADKVEPKFKVGDWIVSNVSHEDYRICKILNSDSEYIIESIDGYRGHNNFETFDKDYHLWTIQDAKDGDVLHVSSFSSDCIFIFDKLDNWILDEPNGEKTVAIGHCCLTLSADNMEFGIQGPDCIEVDTVKPATKIQRDLLFKAMADAGYTFDFEKKELKEVKQEKAMHNKLTDFESSLKHIMEEAIECGDTRNLKADADMLLRLAQKSAEWSKEETRNEDDMFPNLIQPDRVATPAEEYSFNIESELFQQLTTKEQQGLWKKEIEQAYNAGAEASAKWSEVDKMQLDAAIHLVRSTGHIGTTNWLKSLKNRVQPQQEWSEEDETYSDRVITAIKLYYTDYKGEENPWREELLRWFNSLKDRVGCEANCATMWKPSEEQLKSLKEACDEHYEIDGLDPLYTLYEQLKWF